MASILIVEDERLLGKSLERSLADEGHAVRWVASAEAAMPWLDDHQADLALLDIRLPGASGMDLLERMAVSHPDTAVIMMTAHADVSIAVQAMKLGAADFMTKPVDLDALSMIASKNLSNRRISQSWKHQQTECKRRFGLHSIIGESPAIESAKALVRRLATLDMDPSSAPPNVLITGETGTGKDLFARALHYEGRRAEGPFVQVNCAALPDALVESELFGHVKGSFTDARSSKRGLFEVADRGTLFLDEVGTLPVALQGKVLTAIDSGRIRPVGAAQEVQVNVHLVAAMNQDPRQWVEEGRFREDLYHRLRVIHMHLPPLRERGADLDALSERFVGVYCRKFQLPPRKLPRRTKQAIHRYHWPGNVRELSHCLESAVLLSDETVEPERIPAPKCQEFAGAASSDGPSISLDFSRGPISLKSVERELITHAMLASGQTVSVAAQLLDVSRDALRYRLEKHGFDYKKNGSRS